MLVSRDCLQWQRTRIGGSLCPAISAHLHGGCTVFCPIYNVWIESPLGYSCWRRRRKLHELLECCKFVWQYLGQDTP